MADKKQQPSLGAAFKDALLRAAAANPVTGPLALGIYTLTNPSANNGIRDIPRDFAWAPAAAWDLLQNSNRWDRGVSDRVAAGIENWWNKNVKPVAGIGQADMRMATGWKIPEGMKVNGMDAAKSGVKIGPDGTIEDFSALFVRDKKGHTEILTMKDKRWKDIAGPYIGVQAAFMVGSFFVSAPEAVASKGGWVAKGFNAGAKAYGAVEMAGNMGPVGKGLADGVILTPAAIDSIGYMFSDKVPLNNRVLVNQLNQVMGSYSHKEGPYSQQYYFPSLADNDNPYARLDQLSRGLPKGYERDNPFQNFNFKKPQVEISIDNLKGGLQNDKDFQAAFLKAADKHYQGKPLNDKEVLTLRFGLNVLFEGDLGVPLAIKDPATLKDRRAYVGETYTALDNAFREYTVAGQAPDQKHFLQAVHQMSVKADKELAVEHAQAVQRSQSADAAMMAMH